MHTYIARFMALSMITALVGACKDDPETPRAICEEYVAWSEMCWEDPADSDQRELEIRACEDNLEVVHATFGPTCGAKYDAVMRCAAAHPCDAQNACEAEENAASDCLPEPGPVCKAFGKAVAACETEFDDEDLGLCQLELNATRAQSDGCGDAYEALYACFGELGCEALIGGAGCEAEWDTVENSCEFDEARPAPGPRRSSSRFTR
jgi:hypothetical protein